MDSFSCGAFMTPSVIAGVHILVMANTRHEVRVS